MFINSSFIYFYTFPLLNNFITSMILITVCCRDNEIKEVIFGYENGIEVNIIDSRNEI